MSFSSSFLVDSFAAYRILGWQFSSVYILSFNSLLVSTVSGDKSAITVWMLPYTGGVIFLLLLPRFSFSLACNSLCTGMERSVFMLLEVCWDSWMSFSSNTFLAIISLNGFCVCVLPQPWLQPWANRATVPPHSPVFKTVTSINKATGRAAAYHSKLSEPLLTLAEKLLVLTACPSQAKPCYQQSSERSWEEPQAKSHRFPLFSPKFSSFFSTNTSQIVVCLWCISRVLK